MTARKPVMLAIGKASQDVFLQSSKDFQPYEHKGVLYEQLPLGQKIHVDNMIITTGGNATNVAVTFARQGLHSKYAWELGEDAISTSILAALDEEDVDTSYVRQQRDFRPSYSTILLAPTGERTVLNYAGSPPAKSHMPINLDGLKGADWVYLSSINDMELLEKIVTKATEHKVKVMMNPSGLELDKPEKLKSIIEDIEAIALNKEEAQLLVHGETLEELARHMTHYVPVAVVSDGPNGVVATDGKTVVRAGMYEDVKVVDRLGAGDAFGSGFLSQWAQGASLKDSVIFASANSTSVVTKIGAKEGILRAPNKLHSMPISEKPFTS
jgi:ribokinase